MPKSVDWVINQWFLFLLTSKLSKEKRINIIIIFKAMF
ncbi:hypothetical protein [Staphylococcus phage PHB40a]|nr:hypothetical protein [Staphylococcus phage PHB40a]UYD71966.1 hypothetical protein [Staphylococcus phage PHB40a]